MLSVSTYRGLVVFVRVASFGLALMAAAISGSATGLLPSATAARPVRIDERSAGQRITGAARVIDGDTIEVAGTRIRLEGIDAPETAQTCQRAPAEGGGRWNCGHEATRFLAGLIRSDALECVAKAHDTYGRTLATCFLGPTDINAEMVRRGFAWAFVKYSAVYAAEEAAARAARAGIWQASTETAWDYRATRWAAASEAAPAGCAIKGNVSDGGRIYHTPWSPWYAKVVMRAEKGTRWFCSEAEAMAAGWRPAYTR